MKIKNKKLWFSLAALILFAPSLILCLLYFSADEPSLADFADCHLLVQDEKTGETETLTPKSEEHRLVTDFLKIAEQSGKKIKDEGVAQWLYRVTAKEKDLNCRMGVLDGQAVVSYTNKVYQLAFPLLQASSEPLYPSIVRYGIKTGQGYLDTPHLSQSITRVYRLNTTEDVASLHFDISPTFMDILVYPAGESEPVSDFHSLQELEFDTAREFEIFVNVLFEMGAYRVQCTYELNYLPE